MDLTELRIKTNQRLARYTSAREQCSSERRAISDSEQLRANLTTALEMTQTVAKRVQDEAHSRIADVVSRSLSAVFDQPYKFKINFETKRGRTEANLTFERNGLQVDPMTASGGGVLDVASFALRLSCLMLSKPPLRRLLVLDEPWKMLSSEYRPRLKQLLVDLANELKVQFVIVTHSDELKCGTIVSL